MRTKKIVGENRYTLTIHHPGDIDIEDMEVTPKFTLISNMDRETVRELRDQAAAVLDNEVMVENDAARESRWYHD